MPTVSLELWMLIVACVVVLLLIFVFFRLGVFYKKRVDAKTIESAESQKRKIIDEAIKNSNEIKREAQIEAKENALKTKNEIEAEVKERRAEVQRQEKRLQQKEENLDHKSENLEKKDAKLTQRLEELEHKHEAIDKIHQQKLAELEKITGLSQEQAKAVLLSSLEDDVRHEKANILKENETRLKEESAKRAQEIITEAIQRCAVDHVTETTVSTVNLPNDEMKGRLIGREGRNIRSFENITGIDLIVDDTPEAVVISCFDPVRREIARITLERLIVDGRIHPARIEEMFNKATKEVENKVREEGEAASFEANVHGLHPDLVKTLGKLYYRTSYGQNVLKHSLEVSMLSGFMAAELGLDVRLAKRAGLLHDIGKALTPEVEGSHVELGAQLLRKYKENDVVVNACESHHGDVEATSLIAVLVQAADAISAARPGARRETLENYISRLEKLENIANAFQGVEKSFAIQAGREIRLMVIPEQVSDDDMTILARDVAKRIEDEMEYPGQIKVSLIRETRVTDYAK